MTLPLAWPPVPGVPGPGEWISQWLHFGPGAQSFFTAATTLRGVATQISHTLSGQQANAGVLLAAWASPTGEKAVSANTPYGMWLVDAEKQINAAATHIHATGLAFDHAQAMTMPPWGFEALDWSCWTMMQFNFLGLLTPFIAANRAAWGVATSLATAGYGQYTSISAGLAGALTPLTVPPATGAPVPATPSFPAIPAIPGGLAAPIAPAMQGTAALPSVGSAAAQPVSGVASLLSQPASALMSSGSELTQAPASMASSLGSVPSMASATSGLGSPTAGSGSAGADSLSWLGASAGGGTVAASLSGGGAGLSGLGGAAALAPMRGPVSWASTANAANTPPEAGAAVSRIAEARAASGTGMPATSGGMGAPGAMAPAARQASESERERDPLASAAVLYRPPRDMPVVTGAAGAQFVTGREAL